MTAARGMREWYTPMAHLQMVSLELCSTYRATFACHLRVARKTPEYLWMDVETVSAAIFVPLTRVPACRAREVTWELPARRLKYSARVFAAVECFRFGALSSDGFDHVVWPQGLKRLFLGERFNQSVDAASFPASLEELHFGRFFNQPIRRAKWPESLRKMTFARDFNQKVNRIIHPICVRRS